MVPTNTMVTKFMSRIDGLERDCSNSIANALELLHSCTKPSIYVWYQPLGEAY